MGCVVGDSAVEVPEQLEGYAQSADDESDLPFDSSEGNVGYVGISKMTGSLQNRRTADANTRNMTVTEAFDDLVAYIKRRGFEEFVITAPAAAAATTTGGTGTGTGGGTP